MLPMETECSYGSNAIFEDTHSTNEVSKLKRLCPQRGSMINIGAGTHTETPGKLRVGE